ncbi:MAG: 4Fe-4S binding protein [Myxococcales bacterium]|nr:4Fe-4S binding protein [Myxococcales bacterium]
MTCSRTSFVSQPLGSPLFGGRGLVVALVTALLLMAQPVAAKPAPKTLDCETQPCAEVLPGAVSFKPVAGTSYQVGVDAAGKSLGWVGLSTDVVDIDAYSGKPLVTLFGIDGKAVFTGAKVIHHSEPILLVGIPESALQTFVSWYAGKSVSTRVVVGKSSKPGAISVDAISGATVTALAQNQTVLAAGRKLAMDVGVLAAAKGATGEFIKTDKVLSWQQMETAGVFGRLFVSEKQMGSTKPTAADDQFINLWFTVADAPQIGRSLLGDHEYNWLMGRKKADEHLLVIYGVGSSSFKGSGYVRGGIFDRVRVEQGLRQMIFKDHDHHRIGGHTEAKGAPEFKEGAVFFARGGKLHAGEPFDLVFMGSRYDGKGGYSREFHSFSATHRLPDSLYKRPEAAPVFETEEIYVQAWRNQGARVYVVLAILLGVMALFIGRRWLVADMKRLRIIHTSVMLASVLLLGVWLKAQPSVTQMMTFVDGAVHGFRWSLFLSEPLLFISWISIAIVTLIWGRGVFCGWTCPFGSATELLFKLGRLLRLPEFELPDAVHSRLRYLRYVILVVLIGTFIYSPELGERMAEVEPFKTSFLVAPWTRHWGFVAWWGTLVGLSLFWWRPFCRYVCPLGAGLAIPGSFRLSGPYRRNACDSCKICTKTCEPKAIDKQGKIDPRECLSCMECESNYQNEQVCPPLVGIDRLMRRSREKGEPPNADKLARLMKDREDRK